MVYFYFIKGYFNITSIDVTGLFAILSFETNLQTNFECLTVEYSVYINSSNEFNHQNSSVNCTSLRPATNYTINLPDGCLFVYSKFETFKTGFYFFESKYKIKN